MLNRESHQHACYNPNLNFLFSGVSNLGAKVDRAEFGGVWNVLRPPAGSLLYTAFLFQVSYMGQSRILL